MTVERKWEGTIPGEDGPIIVSTVRVDTRRPYIELRLENAIPEDGGIAIPIEGLGPLGALLSALAYYYRPACPHS